MPETCTLANLGYATKLHDRNCQVLIYGDSGAMVGLDPAILLQRTGLSACNIAEFEGMTLVNQTLPLDIFLAHNPAPRYLIFLYAPSNLTISRSWSDIGTFEAISFRLQQKPGLSTAWLLITHPSDTMKWVEGGLRLALTRTKAKPFPSSAAHLRERDDGQLKVPTAHTLTACDPRVFTNLPDRAWLNRLRSQYTTPHHHRPHRRDPHCHLQPQQRLERAAPPRHRRRRPAPPLPLQRLHGRRCRAY